MALHQNTPKGAQNPRVNASAAEPDTQHTAQPKPPAAAPTPSLLSTLVTPADYECYDEEYWASKVLSEEAFQDSNRRVLKRFKRQLKVVFDDADIHDVLLLTEAIKYWRKFHGGDRIQSGYLIASILQMCGFTHRNGIRWENQKKHIAMFSAARRLKADGLEYLDDVKQVFEADGKVERAEDKRLRREVRLSKTRDEALAVQKSGLEADSMLDIFKAKAAGAE